MPRDPRRNIQSYEHQGGNLNEFEFQKSQREMAEDAKPQFPFETDNPTVGQPVAEVMAEAHKIVEKRRKRQAGNGSVKSVKKSAKNSAKKTAKAPAAKKLASVKARRQRLAPSR